MDLPAGPCYANAGRSSNGCWTCRLRHKKCDENHPVCDTCATLHITCHYDQNKPEWMDGGARQGDMAELIKREVKESAHLVPRNRRRAEFTTDDEIVLSNILPRDPNTLGYDQFGPFPESHNTGMDSYPEPPSMPLQRGADCTNHNARKIVDFRRSETFLLMFYLEHLVPFFFPFYNPSPLEGGKAWMLELMISSPVVRQAFLCSSSYFFSLARGNRNVAWDSVLRQTQDAFRVLRQALQVIEDSNISEHLHGAVRVMASIMQVQRFEIILLSFSNCQAHLNAALALFEQLLNSVDSVDAVNPISSFIIVMSRLGSSSWVPPAQCSELPSAEQAGFHFSSALLVLDDIIASTVLQEEPRLYKHHCSLLGHIDTITPPIDLETTVGCKNWALLQIGEIAALDAWKQQCKRSGNLDVIELVHRATVIKNSLQAYLTHLETNQISIPKEAGSFLDVLTEGEPRQSKTPFSQSSLVTRIWTHAALIYLFVVVSGWQPASTDVRHHVGRIIKLLKNQISPPALLRTMVWPFCVAGCLAESEQEAHLREIAEALHPSCVFGTVRKALEIMENVWRNRHSEDVGNRDLAACFRSHGDLVLLV